MVCLKANYLLQVSKLLFYQLFFFFFFLFCFCNRFVCFGAHSCFRFLLHWSYVSKQITFYRSVNYYFIRVPAFLLLLFFFLGGGGGGGVVTDLWISTKTDITESDVCICFVCVDISVVITSLPFKVSLTHVLVHEPSLSEHCQCLPVFVHMFTGVVINCDECAPTKIKFVWQKKRELIHVLYNSFAFCLESNEGQLQFP